MAKLLSTAQLVCALCPVLWSEASATCEHAASSRALLQNRVQEVAQDVAPGLAMLNADISWCVPSGQLCIDGAPVYLFLHIPKSAGASFHDDVMAEMRHCGESNCSTPLLPRGSGYWTGEFCWGDMPSFNADSDRTVTFLREPRSQLYSMFLEMKYNDFFANAPLHRSSIFQDFSTWISHFSDFSSLSQVQDDFGGYHPYNPQTRSLTCRNRQHHLTLVDGQAQQSLELAMSRMSSMFFVGITERYHESLCLFIYKTGRSLPDGCNCKNSTAWAAFNPSHATHGLPPHDVSQLSSEDVNKIDLITQDDAKLYAAAHKRFIEEVKVAETATGTHILC